MFRFLPVHGAAKCYYIPYARMTGEDYCFNSWTVRKLETDDDVSDDSEQGDIEEVDEAEEEESKDK